MLTHRQLLGWTRFHATHPFGPAVDGLESAMTRHTVAAAFGGAKDATLRDFMLTPPSESSELPPSDDPEATLRLLAKKIGATETPAVKAASAPMGE